MTGYRSKERLASAMSQFLADLEISNDPLDQKYLKLAKGYVEKFPADPKIGAPTQWTANEHLKLCVCYLRRHYQALFDELPNLENDGEVSFRRWNSEARKSALADFPWREFPFRSLPEFNTLRDRVNKALRVLRAEREYVLIEAAIVLETVYRKWGDQSVQAIANLPPPFDVLSPQAETLYQILVERDGYLLPQ